MGKVATISRKRILKKALNNSFIDPIFAAPISSLEVRLGG
jgi:hypothetical protein